jgi:hypothetical protein
MSEAAEYRIEREFMRGDLAYIDAILQLQGVGYLPEDAEDMVSEWDLVKLKPPTGR